MDSAQRFRPNVGIMLVNAAHQVLAGDAFHYPGDWMMPQGGIDPNETPHDAMRRELLEETGLHPQQTRLIHAHNEWIEYLFPKPQYKDDIFYVGQKQRWFLLEYNGPAPDATTTLEEEFSCFEWVEMAWLMKNTREFRRTLYESVFAALRPFFPT